MTRPRNLLEGIEAELRKPRAKGKRVNPADYAPGSLELAIRTFHLVESRRARLALLDPWRADVAATMKEDKGRESVESHFVAIVKRLRLPYAYHTYRSDRSAAGYPDWNVVGFPGAGTMYAELKAEDGKFSAAQIDCMLHLEAAGERVTYFSAVDVFTGRMERELTELTKGKKL